jgi:hypothetical protein
MYTFLNILTWFLLLTGLSGVVAVVVFIIWTMTGELND